MSRYSWKKVVGLLIAGFVLGFIVEQIRTRNNVNLSGVLNDLLTCLGIITLIVLAVITILDILDKYGFNVLLFSYSKNCDKKELKKIESIITSYFKYEQDLLLSYSKQRINHFLVQLGLTNKQFKDITFETLKLRHEKFKTESDAKNKLFKICLSNKVLIPLKSGKPSDLDNTYKVDYYINLVDITHEEFTCNEESLLNDMSRMLNDLIIKTIGYEAINEIDKIIIPPNSNILLGLKLGQILNIPVVRMLEKSRLLKSKFWDGDLESTDTVVIIHDVLVSAKQIVSCVENFPKALDKSNIKGIFCLVNREDCDGKDLLEKQGYTVKSIIDLNDNKIENAIRDGIYNAN